MVLQKNEMEKRMTLSWCYGFCFVQNSGLRQHGYILHVAATSQTMYLILFFWWGQKKTKCCLFSVEHKSNVPIESLCMCAISKTLSLSLAVVGTCFSRSSLLRKITSYLEWRFHTLCGNSLCAPGCIFVSRLVISCQL